MDANSIESIVARLARSGLPDNTKRELDTLLSHGSDWSTLLRLAADWELEPIVLSNLLAHFAEAIPDSVRPAIIASARESRAWAVAKSLATLELVRILNVNQVDAIVLKGCAVSMLAYGDSSLRTFSDIDLLVRRLDIAAARDVLLRCGYKRDYDIGIENRLLRDGHALEFSNDRTKVELHPELLPRHLHFDLDVGELFNDSIMVAIGTGKIRSLSRHHLVVYLCAHGAKHAWSSMRWAADLGNLLVHLEHSDVDRILSLAERTHSRRLLAVGIRKVRYEMGTPTEMFPEDALVSESDTVALVDPGATSGKSATVLHRVMRMHPYLPILGYWLRCRERTWDRVASIAILASVRMRRS